MWINRDFMSFVYVEISLIYLTKFDLTDTIDNRCSIGHLGSMAGGFFPQKARDLNK